MAPLEMPCAAASALKRASQASKVPLVRQSAAAAEVARNAESSAANAGALHRCLPIRFIIAADSFARVSARLLEKEKVGGERGARNAAAAPCRWPRALNRLQTGA